MRRFVLLCLPLLAGCTVPSKEWTLTTPDRRERSFHLYVPPSLPPGPCPLVLVLHGGGGHATQTERWLDWDRLADREGFIVCYPDGVDHHWNDGRVFEKASEADDAAFLATVIDMVSAAQPVDPKRVYATGVSNGGFMSHTLGNRFPQKLAAIAPVIGGISPEVAKDFGTGALPVLIIQGTADPLVPYGGGPLALGRGSCIDTVEAAKLWAKRNCCTTDREEELRADVIVDDGCRVRIREWSGGEAPVALVTIEGGGHTWPGGSQYLPAFLVGTVCRDFDATEEIWTFFRLHPRP